MFKIEWPSTRKSSVLDKYDLRNRDVAFRI